MYKKSNTFLSRKNRIALFLFFLCIFASSVNNALAEPRVSAPSAILVDTVSGQVLWSKNSDEKRAVASTTKIMTGILIIENVLLGDNIVTSKKASDAGESEIYLSEGEALSTEFMLYALMLKSANDAAVALAEKAGGNMENFVTMMNNKAKALGMQNTNFSNPHGLENGKHFSTARDMSILANYAMRNKTFRKIVNTRKITIPWTGNKYQRVLENHNKLLGAYDKAIGIKTGYISKSGYCLVSSAKNEGREVIAVILGARSSQEVVGQSQALLEWGLNNFENRTVVKRGRTYANLKISEKEDIPLIAQSSKTMLVSKDGNYKMYVIADKAVKPPITKGQKIGRIEILNDNGENIGNVSLIAKESSKVSLFGKGLVLMRNTFSKIKNFIF